MLSIEDIKKALEIASQNRLEHERMYPSDIPNSVCSFAVIDGLLFDNNPGFEVGEVLQVLTFPYENIYLWTYAENKSSVLLVEVDDTVKNIGNWKPFGYLLKIANAFSYFFESSIEYKYIWVYYFNRLGGIDNNKFVFSDQIQDSFYGQVIHLKELKRYMRIVDLLYKDEIFFTAASLFFNSVESHWFCFFCEFQKGGYKKHPTHEPDLEYRVNEIPKMEAAIVQCCRSIEAILGKPKSRKTEADIYKAKNSWRSKIEIDPDAIFFKTDTSNFDYYYKIFELRNRSAHSYGSVSYEHTRDLTMQAQCFAYLVLDSYMSSHMKTDEAVVEEYSLNMELFDRDNESFGTALTGDSYREYFSKINNE